ncbi:MAG: recombinase zinc beta ribbon domain-containing protein, partial [Clostridiales bacterium]|nr:recombinase zinc beta ribbon domain-containing protein [Clostridiales bacterium]
NDFTINSLRWILRNRAYIGEYRYADVVIPDGMPKIITEEMFEAAQAKASLNKRKHNANNDEPDAPRFWLTGKLFCGECGERVSGGSGTSKTKGRKYYYYSCNNYRKHKCCLKPVRKEMVENAVIRALDDILGDSENLASLAVDISAYYKRINSDDSFLKSLEKNLKDTETALKNLVKALEQGIFSETTQKRLKELETQKTNLNDAIASEKAKLAITEDDYSISKYYMFYKNADFKDEQTRDAVLEYFIDKIYLYNDKIVITCYYSDDKREVRLDELNEFIDSGGTDKGSSCSCYAPPRTHEVILKYSPRSYL